MGTTNLEVGKFQTTTAAAAAGKGKFNGRRICWGQVWRGKRKRRRGFEFMSSPLFNYVQDFYCCVHPKYEISMAYFRKIITLD